MSKLSKAAIILGVLFFVCIGTACALFFGTISNPDDIKNDVLNNGGIILNKDKVLQIDKHDESDLENVNKITIKTDSGNVKLIESDDEMFHYSAVGKYYNLSILSSSGMKFELKKSGGTLEFKQSTPWMIGFGQYFNGEIIVKIPSSFAGDLDVNIFSGSLDIDADNIVIGNLNLKVTSGKITAENLTSQESKIEISSGDIVLNNFKTGNLEIAVSSGEVEINKVETNNLEISVSSGEVEIDRLEAKGNLNITVPSGEVEITNYKANDLNVFVGSGNVSLSGIFNKLDATVRSGDVDIISEKIQNDYKIKVSSGNVNLKLPSGASFNLAGSVGSGKLKNNITDTRYTSKFNESVNGGGYTINVTVSSGYVEIN